MFGPLSVGAIVGIIIAVLLFWLFNGGIDDPAWIGWAAIGAPIGSYVGYLIENRTRR